MVNGSRHYKALESVSIASALSTALTIYPCQIRVHQRWQSKLQLSTARKKEWRSAIAGSSPMRLPVNTDKTLFFTTLNSSIASYRIVQLCCKQNVMQIREIFGYYLLLSRQIGHSSSVDNKNTANSFRFAQRAIMHRESKHRSLDFRKCKQIYKIL